MEEQQLAEQPKGKKEKNHSNLAEEYRETLQRLQAEFENYKKRAEKDAASHSEYANAELVKKLLPVLDSFELAIKNINSDGEKFRNGIALVYAQLHSVLGAEGLKPIKTAGEIFDPYRHEALMQQESAEDGALLEEFQKGYTFKDAVIRHSKVKVGKKEAQC